MGRASHFCSSCSLIDFPALFTEDRKCFRVGTLAAIATRKDCPFCRFVTQIVEVTWAKWKDEVWGLSMSNSITIWVKTTLWAHYGSRSKGDDYAPRKHRSPAHFRYRPSLGSDWTPDTRQRSSYGSPRYTLCELDCVKHAEDFKYFTNDISQDIRQVLTRRKVSPLVDRELLKTWIQECQTNHKHCMATQDNQQAQLRSTGRFRVIDVENMCLFVPSEDISYIAVSYVWGGILHSKTSSERVAWIDSLFYRAAANGSTKPTIPELHSRIRFQKLPLTIQDSISLVKLLGWRYLWVDLLCIRQNDADDKKVLVNKMHLIFEEASFTIVAAGGQDANTPLAGLFSPRSPEPTGELILPSNDNTLFDDYTSFVTEYSKRELSYASDAVAAMMGILNKFNDSSAKPVNIETHGIPSDQLEKGLLWMPLNDTSLQRRSGFPSWSWAGWAGSVAYEVTHVLDHSGWAFRPLYGQSQVGSSGILSIYTYTSEVSSLTLGASFVIRQYSTSMGVPVLVAKVSNSDDRVTVIPDCGSNLTTTSLSKDPGLYKLMIIGKGQRYREISRDHYSKLDTADEYVVLLLERKGKYFERVGISTVPAGQPKDTVEQGTALQESDVLGGQERTLEHRSSAPGLPSDNSKGVMNPGPEWKLQWISLA
ncbi:hypothetical protein HG530_005484 [Fusarium avenaceum]|nr:hypothetical protein HG530_005484 [Fusarium avenaceum]